MPVDARGELHLVAPTGNKLRLLAQGDLLRIDVPAWDDVSSLAPSSFSALRRSVRSAAPALLAAGLKFELAINGKTAFAIGTGVKPNLLSRLLGLRVSRFWLRRAPLSRFLG